MPSSWGLFKNSKVKISPSPKEVYIHIQAVQALLCLDTVDRIAGPDDE
jgi:hypothetical protein